MKTGPLEPIGETEEGKREAAFVAAPFFWRKVPLKALSIGREGDWLMHCRRIGLPELGVAMMSAETFLPHAVRLLWFCAHEEFEWLAHWMVGGATFLLDVKMRRWAETNILPGEQGEVVKLATEIYDRAHATMAVRTNDEETEVDDDAVGEGRGLSDARSTSRSSHGPCKEAGVTTRSSTGSRRRRGGPTCTATGSQGGGSTSGRGRSRGKRRNCGAGGRSE